jgi:hypothetical protein
VGGAADPVMLSPPSRAEDSRSCGEGEPVVESALFLRSSSMLAKEWIRQRGDDLGGEAWWTGRRQLRGCRVLVSDECALGSQIG